MPRVNTITLVNSDFDYVAGYIEDNARWPFPTIPPDVCKGKSVVICGAGPSLQTPEALETIHYMRKTGGHVWGCNHALKWLKNNNKYVTHGTAVDCTDGMIKHWQAGYDVKYLLASSVSPKLVSMLVKHGRRAIAFFHNHIGTLGKAEMQLYETLYDATVLVGEGLNVVNRVIRVADYMGYQKIFIAGADCGMKVDGDFHVGGGTPEDEKLYGYATPELCEIVGFKLRTTADMALSAVDLAKAKRKYGNRLILLGNTFPKAICGRSDDWYRDNIIGWEEKES